MIRQLTIFELRDRADHIIELLQKGVDHTYNEKSVDDYYYECLTFNIVLHGKFDNGELKYIIGTQLKNYPRKKVVFITVVAGKDFNKDEVDSYLTQLAEDNFCQAIEAWGRKGWVRLLESLGAKVQYQVLVKEL